MKAQDRLTQPLAPPRALEPALVRVEEAARFLSLGRSKTYELVTRGDLPSVRIGRSVRVPLASLRAWVQAQVEAQTGDKTGAR